MIFLFQSSEYENVGVLTGADNLRVIYVPDDQRVSHRQLPELGTLWFSQTVCNGLKRMLFVDQVPGQNGKTGAILVELSE